MCETKILSISRLRFGTDGQGIRTLVGFMECNLHCKYCINPNCHNFRQYGITLTPYELLNEVEVDNIYFLATNGGITFGGGEPLLYGDYIRDFINIAPKEWSFNVETSLSVPYENVERVADLIDLFIVDIKTLDEKIYKEYTGAGLNLAKENLEKLLNLVGSEKILVRVPVINGFADEKSQDETVKKLLDMGITRIDKFKYVSEL